MTCKQCANPKLKGLHTCEKRNEFAARPPHLVKPPSTSLDFTHCDDFIHEHELPLCFRYWLFVNRLPAIDGMLVIDYKGDPECYATWNGKRVRLVMASRFGDIGITTKLQHDRGYEKRVAVDELSDFGDKP